MKVYHGNILTVDKNDTVAEYLVENCGRIVYVGDSLPEAFKDAKTIELREKALVPSFADTHIHFASFATFYAGLNVMEAKSNSEILEMLQSHVRKSKEKIITGFGASPYSVSDGHLVRRTELDRVCPDKPVFIVKYDGHACVINTALLNKIRDKIKGLRGFHEDTGEMNQEAFFAVSDYVTNSVSPLHLIKNMQKAADYMASVGIGMIHSVSGVGFSHDLDVDMERYFGAGLKNGMQYRVFFQTMDTEKVIKRGLTRIGGCFETALDGCFGSKDASLLTPYENSNDCGVLYYSDEKVTEFCKKANRAGLQIEMHAIGDRAFNQATRALKAALDDYPREDHRHTIIHACLPTEEGIEICKKYNISLSVQTAFIDWRQEPDEYLKEILGARSKRLNPIKTFSENCIRLSAGSDAPCTTPDPINWMYKACNHSCTEEALSVKDALRMCTYNGYLATFDEKDRGSLETGKIADMAILSENPYTVPKERLGEIKVTELLLGGKTYESAVSPIFTHIMRGIKNKGNC